MENNIVVTMKNKKEMLKKTNVSGVYAFMHKVSNSCDINVCLYVGASKNVKNRIYKFFHTSDEHHSLYMKIITDYLITNDPDNIFVICEQCSCDILRRKEKEWFDTYNPKLNNRKMLWR